VPNWHQSMDEGRNLSHDTTTLCRGLDNLNFLLWLLNAGEKLPLLITGPLIEAVDFYFEERYGASFTNLIQPLMDRRKS
jgi:hypothetical protein